MSKERKTSNFTWFVCQCEERRYRSHRRPDGTLCFQVIAENSLDGDR